MSEGAVNYDVTAWLRQRGNFAKEMKAAASAMRPAERSLGVMSDRAHAFGRNMAAGAATTAATWAKTAAAIGGVVTLMSGGGLIAGGLRFNKTMEDAQLSMSTMYNLFNFSARAADVLSGKTSQFAYNMGLAKASMSELYEIAKRSPGSFRDVTKLYQGAAAGLSKNTEDVSRHMQFVEKASQLSGLAENFETLGAQMGRVMAGSAGAEMNVWKVMVKPAMEAAQRLKLMKVAPGMRDDKFTEQFNKLGGDARLQILMEAMGKIGPEVMKANAESMEGLVSSTRSALDTLSGGFTKTLYDNMKKTLLRLNGEGGLFGTKSLLKFQEMSEAIGGKMASAFDRIALRLEKGAEYLRDNWEDVSNTVYKSLQIGAGLIKGAFAYGLAKMIAGSVMMAGGGIGKGLSYAGGMMGSKAGAGRALSAVGRFGTPTRGRDEKTGRFAKGAFSPLLLYQRLVGKMTSAGQGLTAALLQPRKSLVALGGQMARLNPAISRFGMGLATSAMQMAPMVLQLGLMAVAAGMVAVVVGGLAAYLISNWRQIADALIKGLDDGTISLTPLITAAYVLWARFVLVGQALVGGTSSATTFQGMINAISTGMDVAGKVMGFLIRRVADMVGAWGAMKLAMQGVMYIIVKVVEFISELPGVGSALGFDAELVARARANYDAFSMGVQDTFTKADELYALADKLSNIELKDTDFAKIQRDAEKMEKSLRDMLSPEKGKGLKSPRGPKVKIEKVVVEIDLRGEDPDRVMTAFVEPLERLADRRIQAFDVPEGGA